MTVSQTSIEGSDAAFTQAIEEIHPSWMIALGIVTLLTGFLAMAFPIASTAR